MVRGFQDCKACSVSHRRYQKFMSREIVISFMNPIVPFKIIQDNSFYQCLFVCEKENYILFRITFTY